MPRDYTAIVSTANGRIKAAPAKLERIEVGDITVFDVPALVLPDEALSKNLLGVSFLSRLRRYECRRPHAARAVIYPAISWNLAGSSLSPSAFAAALRYAHECCHAQI